MNYEECKEIIIFECIARDGLLIKLRGHEFSKAQFEKLFGALLAYREINPNSEVIEKEIVYCLYFLDLELGAALNSFSKDAVIRDIRTAHEKCSQLIIEIIAPENFYGSPPENFL